jgi:hypothetical protein
MSNPKDRPVSQLSNAELLAELARREAFKNKLTDMTEMELTGEDFGEQAKDALLQARFDALGPEDDRPKKCPRCGAAIPVRARNKRRIIKTLSGSVQLARNYHYCRKCRLGFFPRDIELGLPSKGAISSELERRILDFAINDPFEQAAERWSMHYNFAISSNLLRRVTERVGIRAEACSERCLQHALQPTTREKPKLVVVENDGSLLPMRDGEGWREAKLGMVTRGENRLIGRRGQRGMVSEARYVAVIGGPDDLARSLGDALRVEHAERAENVVWLADGAPSNWRLADRLQPGCTQVLDWHHAVEHAMICARALLGENDALLPTWQQRAEQLLLAGANRIISELMDCLDEVATLDERIALNDLVRYYRANARRMDYARYLERGYPIASGAIESAHRHVLQVRMKRAGQRWSIQRARRMVRLRAAYRTGGARRLHAAIQQAAVLTRGHQTHQRRRLRASNH